MAIVNYVDIFIAAETKINESFPTAQFATDGFNKPLRRKNPKKLPTAIISSFNGRTLRKI